MTQINKKTEKQKVNLQLQELQGQINGLISECIWIFQKEKEKTEENKRKEIIDLWFAKWKMKILFKSKSLFFCSNLLSFCSVRQLNFIK